MAPGRAGVVQLAPREIGRALEPCQRQLRGHGRGDARWVALLHRPGPEAPANVPVFEDPRFGEHLEFLARMQSQGYLIAAGPMLDAIGEGMTILRLPGEGRLEDAERLATTEDASVRSGFFEVRVRPWRVMMSPGA